MMQKLIFALALCLLPVGLLFAQNIERKKTLHLKNGDILTGELLLQTNRIVILMTEDGKRYQFPLSEIKTIEEKAFSIEKREETGVHRWACLVDLNGGIGCTFAAAIGTVPMFSTSLVLGLRKAAESILFVGGGVGMESFAGKGERNRLLAFLPVFVHVQVPFVANSLNPFVGMKAGYAFGLQRQLSGGLHCAFTGGISVELGNRRTMLIGLTAKMQSVVGRMIERNELGEFLLQGTTAGYSAGLNLGFLF